MDGVFGRCFMYQLCIFIKSEKEKTNMKKWNILLAALLTITAIMGTTVPVEASSSVVNIEVKATTMDQVSVTVPTLLPIVFNEDGSNTLPTNWTIENKSTIAGIHLKQIDMVSKGDVWKLLADSRDTKTLSADTKAMKFSIGKEGELKVVAPTEGTEHSSGQLEFATGEISIPSGKTQKLDFGVERGAFTESQAYAEAFNMVLTFRFN